MLIDLILVIFLVIAIFKGYRKGLIVGVFSVLAFVIGLAAALKLSSLVADWLQQSITISAKWLPFIAFMLVFLVVVILVRLGANLIEKAFQVALLGWVNRLGGILLYAVLYLLILSIFIFYAEKLQLLQPAAIESSQTYPFVQPWGPEVINNLGRLIPVFKDMFTELGAFFSSIPDKISH